MPIVEIKRGNILEAKEAYVAHQINSVTVKSHGLAAAIAQTWPWADVYTQRKAKSANTAATPTPPGTLVVCTDPTTHSPLTVIGMVAQYTPGKVGAWSKYYAPLPYPETTQVRQQWFQECLEALDALALPSPVAMPFQIGCGLAGGDWSTYKAMLQNARTAIMLYQL